MLKKIQEIFRRSFSDEESRQSLLFKLLNIVLCVVAFTMTVVNKFTGETTLMYATMAFSITCLLNYILEHLCRVCRRMARVLFVLEALTLLAFFIVTGIPSGFSVLWITIIPSFAIAVFGMGVGSTLSALTFLMVIFFFWLPFGRNLLQYEYTETFMLRFPFVYVCLWLIALYVEWIRGGTVQKLNESESRYRYLYRHDALTGLHSRHAFYEEMEKIFELRSDEHVAVLLFDVDDFKAINDRYGHTAGDEVLRSVSRIITENICEHCTACRWGGEEFLVLMQCRHNPYEIAERVRKCAEETVVVSGEHCVRYTISAGVSTVYSLEKSRIVEFINAADSALYQSKAAGKNRTSINNMFDCA